MTITYARGIPGGVVIAGPSDESEPLYYCDCHPRHRRPVIPSGPFFAMVLRDGTRSLSAGWPSLEKAASSVVLQDALNRGNFRRASR